MRTPIPAIMRPIRALARLALVRSMGVTRPPAGVAGFGAHALASRVTESASHIVKVDVGATDLLDGRISVVRESRSEMLLRILDRSVVVYVVAWFLSWINLFLATPPSWDAALPAGPLRYLQAWVAGVLGLDSLYGMHIGFALILLLALACGWLWAAVDRDVTRDKALARIGRTLTRYGLMAGLFAYGIPLLLAVHAAQPDPVDWASLMVEFEPREIMHMGMGYSPYHERYVGLTFVLAGVALHWPQTTKLGALLTLLLVGNAAMMVSGFMHGGTHLEYGIVGVLGHFLLLAVILLAPDAPRLLYVFVLGRPAVRPGLDREAASPGRSQLSWTKAVTLGLLATPALGHALVARADLEAKSALSGVYYVESFTRDGRLIPLTFNEPARWHTVAIGNYADHLVIRRADGKRWNFRLGDSTTMQSSRWRRAQIEATAEDAGTLLVHARPGDHPLAAAHPAMDDFELSYRRLGPERLELAGALVDDTIVAALRRLPNQSFAIYDTRWR